MRDTIDNHLCAANQQAWDALYRRTPERVWGDRPIGFLEEFAGQIRPDLREDARILDAGAGEGRNLGVLLRLEAQVYACDSSPSALEKIPARVRELVRTSVCDLSELPFEDRFFDLVLATDVVETLPDADTALAEIHRVLTPGGKLLCNIPGFEDEISAIDMRPLGANRFLFRGRYFYHFMSEGEACDLLTRHGFAILRSEIRQWSEEAHPEFRGNPHVHTSRVFLVTKAA